MKVENLFCIFLTRKWAHIIYLHPHFSSPPPIFSLESKQIKICFLLSFPLLFSSPEFSPQPNTTLVYGLIFDLGHVINLIFIQYDLFRSFE